MTLIIATTILGIELSVIIVNYNVKFYLEQCLASVLAASEGHKVEVIVVDNVSTDGSVEYIREHFPQVKCIANKENIGFSRANNRALEHAQGKYVLFLNPDTVVPEDCFTKCLAYMESHPECAALGPHLIDGTGKFLPESKRGFPSLSTAFYKITGLYKIFPKSPKINAYYMGNLPEHETNFVDVLVGCFMLMPKHFLDEYGGFDPDYFMYGEDIDLSYRVRKAGYRNVYFPQTTVIHYKGESTQKGSLNYMRMFYESMITFAEKHFTQSKSRFFILFLRIAIVLKGILSFILSKLRGVRLYIFDFLITLGSLFITKNIWNESVKPEITYDTQLTNWAFVVYSLIWILILYLNGVYDKPYRRYRIWRGIISGAIVIMAVYSLLPVEYRFSRGITLFGTMISGLVLLLYRRIFTWLDVPGFDFKENQQKGIIVMGKLEDTEYISATFDTEQISLDIKGTVADQSLQPPEYLGQEQELDKVAKMLFVHEIIFTQSAQLSFREIIDWFQKLAGQYEFKIFRKNANSIIGSNSRNTAGDLYSIESKFALMTPSSRRNKRFLDFMLACLFALLSPLLLINKKGKHILKNIMPVWLGNKTWVGYKNLVDDTLPSIKPVVIDIAKDAGDNEVLRDRVEYDYAKSYHPYDDLKHLNRFLFA